MKSRKLISILLLPAITAMVISCTNKIPTEIPKLKKTGETTQLFVDGKPFLVLAGELHNSSSSSREYMKEIWPKLSASGMNTVLAAVEWSLIEPVEGKFDFKVVDDLIADARSYNLRLVLLWFGSWKNGQTHYAPEWVKKDFKRFPRVKAENGKPLEILSTFGNESLQADSRALEAMMKHIKETDSEKRTVIMIQVENEVGILGSPRDHSDAANKAFAGAVPQELMDKLIKNKEHLLPELNELWLKTGYKTSGTWEEVFGKNDKTDELFTVWNYATYVGQCTKAAKAEYPIPMFVNAWLVQPDDKRPGDYPSGGPQAHLHDIWRAAAPDIDLLCPDIYLTNFEDICALYTRNNNALFIPESRAGEQGVAQLFYAIGKYKAIGYAPFGFESRMPGDEKDPFTKAYHLLSGFSAKILEAQANDKITSVLLRKGKNESEEVTIGGYRMLVELQKSWRQNIPETGYGIIVCTGNDEYMIYGSDIQISFTPATPGPAVAAISQVDEGVFIDGNWVPGRRLNGDDIALDINLAKMALENKTGTGLKFSGNSWKIQYVKLYRFE